MGYQILFENSQGFNSIYPIIVVTSIVK